MDSDKKEIKKNMTVDKDYEAIGKTINQEEEKKISQKENESLKLIENDDDKECLKIYHESKINIKTEVNEFSNEKQGQTKLAKIKKKFEKNEFEFYSQINSKNNEYRVNFYDITNFVAFNSINNIFLIIYLKDHNQIICENLIKKKKILTLKLKSRAESLKYISDTKQKMDIIIIINFLESEVYFYNCLNFEKLFALDKHDFMGALNSINIFEGKYNELFLYIYTQDYINNKKYFLYINFDDIYSRKFQKISFKSNIDFIKLFINSGKKYIIFGKSNVIYSYNIEAKSPYQKYIHENYKYRNEPIISNFEKKTILIISLRREGNILIWNFDSGELINNICEYDYDFNAICLFDKRHLIIGTYSESILLYDYIDKNYVKDLNYSFIQVKNIKAAKDCQNNNYIIVEQDDGKIIIIKQNKF